MQVEYGPIPRSPDHLDRLRELCLSPGELEKASYIRGQLSPSDLDRKRRCEHCCRVLNRSGRDSKRHGANAPTTASAPAVPPAPQDPDRLLRLAQDAEVEAAFEELTVSLTRRKPDKTKAGSKKGEKPVEPVIRCRFHPGRVAHRRWTCCGNSPHAKPCRGEELHSPRRYATGELEMNWIFYATPPASPSGRPPAAAVVIDCEMGTADSGESELIRVSVVDYFSREVLLDSLVWPDVPMAHLNTKYSGISRPMMDDARRRRRCLLGRDEARMAVWRLVGPDTVVVGHAAHQDLACLRWIHPRVVDTLVLERRRRQLEREADEAAKAAAAAAARAMAAAQGPAPHGDDDDADDDNPNPDDNDPAARPEAGLSLKALASQRLGRAIQLRGRGHDSVEDALATRDLLLWHVGSLDAAPAEQAPLLS